MTRHVSPPKKPVQSTFPDEAAPPKPQKGKGSFSARDFAVIYQGVMLGSNLLLVVSTPLKNISQNGNLPQIGMKIKNIWNHQPVTCCWFARGYSWTIMWYMFVWDVWRRLPPTTVPLPPSFGNLMWMMLWMDTISTGLRDYAHQSIYIYIYIYIYLYRRLFLRVVSSPLLLFPCPISPAHVLLPSAAGWQPRVCHFLWRCQVQVHEGPLVNSNYVSLWSLASWL